MKHSIGELDTVGLDVEILTVDLVANGIGHCGILSWSKQTQEIK